MIYQKINLSKEEYIQTDLNDRSFINVCIQQRHAWLYDRELFDKATDAVEKIKKQIIGEPSNNLIHKEYINHQKEFFLVISMFGSDGADRYRFFSSSPAEVTENICNLVFTKKNFEQLKIIQTFSQKYEGYDALSLTTFEDEDIDSIILDLKKQHDSFRKKITIKNNQDECRELFELLESPKCYEEILEFKKLPIKDREKLEAFENNPRLNELLKVAENHSLYDEKLKQLKEEFNQAEKIIALHSYSKFLPKIYHKSMFHEKVPLLKIISNEGRLFIEVPSRITQLEFKKPKINSLNLERYLYDIVRTIEAYIKEQSDIRKLKEQHDLVYDFSHKNCSNNPETLGKYDSETLDKINFGIYKKDIRKLKELHDYICEFFHKCRSDNSETLGKYDLETLDKYNIYNLINLIKKDTDTSIIKKLREKYEPELKKKYAQKSKTTFKQPVGYFFDFCGIKIWDLRHKKGVTVEKATDIFREWFHHKFPNKKNKLKENTIGNNYDDIAKLIKEKTIYEPRKDIDE